MRTEWNSTEAYDLSLYEEAPARIRKEKIAEPAAAPKSTVRKKVSAQAAARTLTRRMVACAVLTIALLGLILYHNVSVIELGDEIQSQRDVLVSLQNEYSYLSGKLTTRTASEVDNYAAAKHLCKVEDYQVAYIQLNNADQAYRTQDAPTGSLLESIMDGMDTILEYLRIK